MVRNIGKELGTYEAHMITKTSAKVRVMVNGLKPIIKETIIEFDSGEECKITLEYDKLENHCSLCGLLSHQASRCPTLLVEEVHKRDQSRASRGVATEALNQSAEEKQEDPSYHSQAFHQRVDRHGRSFGNRISTKQTRVPPPQQDNTSLVIRNQPSQPSQERKALQIKKTSRSWREKSHHDRPKEGMFPPYTKERAVPIRNYQRGKDLFSSRSEGIAREAEPAPLVPSMETVMEELQEATRQYLSCPDPVEAAARRQRVNIGDAKGEMEAAALSIIKAAEGKLASSYIVRTGDSNPVTPPPLHNGYPVTHPPLQEVCLQDLASSDCVVLHTPQDNGKGEGSSNQPLNEVIILRSPSTPLEKRAEPKKLKSIIISPPDATTGNNLTRDEPTPPVEVVQSPANRRKLEEEEALSNPELAER
uniref:Zinc knuckle CX2CX4HX4C domain-containing protein n=1 Tax=Brassica campestris TaxID=3711 RepID=M4D973_BRACM